MLTALGGCEAELHFHIKASLRVGVTPEEILEVFLQSAVYCGFPKVLNALAEATKIFASQGIQPSNREEEAEP